MFCFVLESCEHQVGRLEPSCRCPVQHKALLATEGSAINKIPNIPYSTLPPHLLSLPFVFQGGSGAVVVWMLMSSVTSY